MKVYVRPDRTFRRSVLLLVLFTFCFAWSQIPCEGQNFIPGYCTFYAGSQFSGIDWEGDAQDWLVNAQAKGWKTTSDPHGAKVGAIVVWSGGSYGHVAIVRTVYADSISIEEMNYGEIVAPKAVTTNFNRVTSATLKFSSLDRKSLKFKGYILHEKVQSPPANSTTYTVNFTVTSPVSGNHHPYVTFYGINRYYQHVEVKGNTVRLTGVPGGPGVKVRIDVDFANGRHASYYNQEISGPNQTVNFSYTDTTHTPDSPLPSAEQAARIAAIINNAFAVSSTDNREISMSNVPKEVQNAVRDALTGYLVVKDGRLFYRTGNYILESQGMRGFFKVDTLQQADRMNGFEFRGAFGLAALNNVGVSRSKCVDRLASPNDPWSPWNGGRPQLMVLFEKKQGSNCKVTETWRGGNYRPADDGSTRLLTDSDRAVIAKAP